jgi:hypothetical protein
VKDQSARRATGSEHDEIRRRLEATGGAAFEVPSRAEPQAQVSEPPAGQRIRLQRRGEPEFILREGLMYSVSGVMVAMTDLPKWARNSIMTAALAIRRIEYAAAKRAESQAQKED